MHNILSISKECIKDMIKIKKQDVFEKNNAPGDNEVQIGYF